jgi:glycosyltransferase involved in cell wall biosynthesis
MLTGPVLACLERELATYRPEVVVLSGIHLVEAIPLAKRVGAGLVVVDLHNAESRLILEFLRVARLPRDVVHWAVFWWGTRCLEIRYLRAADELWAVSAQDAAALAPVAGKAEVVEVPNVVDTRWYDASCSTFDWLPGVLYVGRFDYPPNAVAARLLIERIHPEVTARVPGAVLYLVGRSPTPFMRAAARSDPSVVVTDEVPDTRPYLDRAAVVAVPLLQGGGTRLKILESLAAGKAVVSTPKGCEGLDVRDGEHLLIRHVGEFAEAIVGLLQDAPLRSRLGRAGRELVERRYSPAALRRILADRLARLG